jgi:hypothetical protein
LLLAATPACGSSSDLAAAPMTCTTEAVPDMSFSDVFTIDTGFPGDVGTTYGQSACAGQYLVEVDLTAAVFQGHDFFASARWSVTLPATPCDQAASMTTFVFDGTTWTTWDVVPYVGVAEGTICHAQPQSHLDPGSAQLGGTNVPGAGGFQRARLAVRAWSGSTQLPVFVAGETN